jgi:chromate transporter
MAETTRNFPDTGFAPGGAELGVSFGQAAWVWARVAALSFGGPAGQIAVMHRILVEEKKWIGEARFLFALNYCMLLPGPEAHQLAVYIGWLINRVWGGLLAGILFILPGLVSLGILSWIYVTYGELPLVQGLFFGLKAAVLAVVLEAVLRIGKRALKNNLLVAIAATAFVGIFFLAVPFPLLILMAAIAGLLGSRFWPELFRLAAHGGKGTGESDTLLDRIFAKGVPEHVKPSATRLAATLVIGLILWLGPLAVLHGTLGWNNVFTQIAVFNDMMAVVTFGGAYAVLAYMAQQAVEFYGWLRPDEMLVGLGFAETTPGPLISVVQFVGFLAAYRMPGTLDPVLAGTLGGLLAMWCTFVPSFLWIFLGGLYVEALQNRQSLRAALSAITAAVVGVVLNLAIWFALHTLFAEVSDVRTYGIILHIPMLQSIDWAALLLSFAAIIAIFRFKAGVVVTLAGCASAGVLLTALGG